MVKISNFILISIVLIYIIEIEVNCKPLLGLLDDETEQVEKNSKLTHNGHRHGSNSKAKKNGLFGDVGHVLSNTDKELGKVHGDLDGKLNHKKSGKSSLGNLLTKSKHSENVNLKLGKIDLSSNVKGVGLNQKHLKKVLKKTENGLIVNLKDGNKLVKNKKTGQIVKLSKDNQILDDDVSTLKPSDINGGHDENDQADILKDIDHEHSEHNDSEDIVGHARDQIENSLKVAEKMKLAKGANGVKGAHGANGANGAHGAHGAHGANGANGAHGAHGANGANDAHGTKGAHGAKEAHGAKGAHAGIDQQKLGSTAEVGDQAAEIDLGTSEASNMPENEMAKA